MQLSSLIEMPLKVIYINFTLRILPEFSTWVGTFEPFVFTKVILIHI